MLLLSLLLFVPRQLGFFLVVVVVIISDISMGMNHCNCLSNEMTNPLITIRNDWCLSLTLNCLHNCEAHYKLCCVVGIHKAKLSLSPPPCSSASADDDACAQTKSSRQQFKSKQIKSIPNNLNPNLIYLHRALYLDLAISLSRPNQSNAKKTWNIRKTKWNKRTTNVSTLIAWQVHSSHCPLIDSPFIG